MKRLLILAALLLPFVAHAQFAGRASAEADYKIAKGLHVSFEEELRSNDDFSSLGSLRHTLGVSYKVNKYFKVGGGYTLINPYKSSANTFNYPRHRFFLDATGSYKFGDFQLSLKEKLQLTHRTGDFNVYQTTPNALMLKSRAGVKYKGFESVEPYASLEVRTFLNGPWGSTSGSLKTHTTSSGNTKTYYAYTPSGYTHVYNNRYRLGLGADIKLSKQHSLTPYLLLDYCSDYEIDTDGDGTRLYTETTAWEDSFCATLGLQYVFKF